MAVWCSGRNLSQGISRQLQAQGSNFSPTWVGLRCAAPVPSSVLLACVGAPRPALGLSLSSLSANNPDTYASVHSHTLTSLLLIDGCFQTAFTHFRLPARPDISDSKKLFSTVMINREHAFKSIDPAEATGRPQGFIRQQVSASLQNFDIDAVITIPGSCDWINFVHTLRLALHSRQNTNATHTNIPARNHMFPATDKHGDAFSEPQSARMLLTS